MCLKNENFVPLQYKYKKENNNEMKKKKGKKKLEKGKGRIWGFGFGFCVVDIMENAGSKGQRRQIERECWENNKIIIITKIIINQLVFSSFIIEMGGKGRGRKKVKSKRVRWKREGGLVWELESQEIRMVTNRKRLK